MATNTLWLRMVSNCLQRVVEIAHLAVLSSVLLFRPVSRHQLVRASKANSGAFKSSRRGGFGCLWSFEQTFDSVSVNESYLTLRAYHYSCRLQRLGVNCSYDSLQWQRFYRKLSSIWSSAHICLQTPVLRLASIGEINRLFSVFSLIPRHERCLLLQSSLLGGHQSWQWPLWYWFTTRKRLRRP